MNLNLNESLNFCLKPRADIITLWIRHWKINIGLKTLKEAYDLNEMNY